jgi:hypothetical protein
VPVAALEVVLELVVPAVLVVLVLLLLVIAPAALLLDELSGTVRYAVSALTHVALVCTLLGRI